MTKIQAAITGVHGYVPDYVLTNQELATLVDTNDEWITSRTGIKERRLLKTQGWATSDMAVEAIRGLLAKTDTKPEEVELLICATVTGDLVFPDTANTICYKLGATNAWAYDLNAACSGFLYALITGAKFIESGMHKKVVIVGADMMSSIIDYTDRATCIIFGDGAGAVLLEPTEEGVGIIDGVMRGDGAGREFLNIKGGGSLMPASHETVDKRLHYAYQNGQPVFKAAVKGMTSTINEVLKRNEMTINDVDWLVPHQANKRIIQSVGDGVGIPNDRVMMNIHKYGNTTGGTLPLCLWDYENQLKKGDNLMLTAFGGGFTWGSIFIRWAYDGLEFGV
ncbi:MAG: beta-ketoacyl-ACP synthase III [Saprospiraceae bacterium]|nr:beta-ketoacyl-ACP synthase III [Saprospiraceae bacterium]